MCLHRQFRHLAVYASGLALWTFSLPLHAAPPATPAGPAAADVKQAPSPFPSEAPPVPEALRRALQDRQYADALKAIDAAAADPKAAKDYLGYLKGQTLHLAQKYDDAVAAYEAVEKNFAASRWASRARVGRAVSLARKGDFRGAELIYREEATRLLSLERKQEIADIYLEFARSYFKPADENQKADYNKALEFFGKALEVGPKLAEQAEIELLMAQCYQQLNNFQEAAKRFEKFSKDHPKSPLDIEARFRLGESQLSLNQREEARRTWQDLLAAYPDNASARIPEAAFNIAQTYNIPNPQSDEDLSLGIAALEAFLKKYPTHKLAGAANLRIAASYISRGRYEEAVKSLKRFLDDPRYADREEAPQARNLLGRSYQLQKKFPEALAAWRDYLVKHPAHEAWSAVQRQIIDTEFLLGYEAREAKKYDEARRLWSDFMARYPLDPRNPSILYEFGRLEYQQDKFDEAIAEWRRLVSKYPNTNESSQAQFMIAATLEDKLHKLPEALKEYKKVTWGNHAAPAQQRIARLTAKSMNIASERVFRSNETPKIKLTTRNIEKVSVRAFAVDMETYFRKMHLTQGVENLDISLIDPDSVFEFKVPDYVEHQQLEHEIEVPLPKDINGKAATSGVLAVTVSSATLEATTLVLQSDLDIVVKSSRDEVFVFAENLLTGKPWPGARLLISNGGKIFAEETAGPDGVFQKDYKELREPADVRVFAVADGNVASNVVNLNGVGLAQGLADKGYLFTDRPAYRAGQMVHVRGIVRRAEGDAYTIEKGKKYKFEVYDARNRMIRQDEVKLDDFGGFHAHFNLPGTCPPGNYRLQICDDDGRSYQGAFTVHEYQLEPVQLSVQLDRKVYYRGEEIEGKIVAKFYYGAPLVGREIRYQLAGGRQMTGKTDEKGEVAFKFPTREFRESQTLPLTAQLPERNLQTVQNLYLTTQGFSIDVSTVRSVYIAGETFEVTIKTTDAEGKPTGQKLALHVLEQTTVDHKVGEREVEKREITTDAKEGKTRVTLKLDQGANYVLRVEGTDRFSNPITGARPLQISDDKDAVRLRILADRHTFKVGDTAKVQLHWREPPALALITFQGARVLAYQLVELKTGVNDLPIPMTAKLAPNFELSVAVMTDARPPKEVAKRATFRRFHNAASPFAVERDLRVQITQQRKDKVQGPIRPGDEIEVTVTTTDPQGAPVSAEVSVAMIEQALLNMYGSQVQPIQDFFRGNLRAPAVRTTSTVEFAYHPQTKPINARLLAEKDRVELATEEELRRRALGDVMQVAESVVAQQAQAAQAAEGLGVNSNGGLVGNVVNGQGALEYVEGTVGPPNQIDAIANLAQNEFTETKSISLGIAQTQTIVDPRMVAQGQAGQQAKAENERDMFRGLNKRQFGVRQNRWGTIPGNGPASVAGTTPVFDSGSSYYEGESLSFDDRNPVSNLSINTLFFTGDDNAPTSHKLGFLAQNGQREVSVLNYDGSYAFVNLGDVQNEKLAGDLSGKLKAAGAVLVPMNGLQETGYWNPAVVTDKAGKATVTLTVPERSTAWKILAKGITTETLAGEAEAELVVKKDLFGELKLPLAFTDGDDANVLVSVHNDALEQGPIEITLKTTIGGKSVEEKKTLTVKNKGLQEMTFKAALRLPEETLADPKDPKKVDPKTTAAPDPTTALFELTLVAGDRRDVLRRAVPVQPYGMPVYSTASGTATGDTTAWVEPPKDMKIRGASLQVIVGPTVERSLLDVVLGPVTACGFEMSRISSGLDTATSDLLASLGLQKMLTTTRDAGGPQTAALDTRVRSSIGLLISSQSDDGGWSWTGQGGKSDRYATARVVWALSLAKSNGYSVPDDAYEKAMTYVNAQIVATAENDYDSKAILLQSLAAAGRGDFTLANRLYRNRPSLSNAALAHLALAFVSMDRKPMAGDVLQLLGERNLADAAPRRRSAIASLPWTNAESELRALYLLALEQTAPGGAKAKEQIDWLLAHRAGNRWSPDKATGPATLGLSQYYAKTRFQNEHYKLTVFVNDYQTQVLEFDADAGTQVIDVPVKLLKTGKQRINFQIAGRGRYAYQCLLSGFVPADELKNSTPDWYVRRYYEPAPRELDGQSIPRGFNMLQGNYTTFRNPLTQLPVGQRAQVELDVNRTNLPANTTDEQLEYLVVTDPLPSGATVIEQSVKGNFDRYEITPGAITFYIGTRRYVGDIRYDIHGYVPGSYRAAPTVVRNAYRPEQWAVSQTKPLTVLPLGAVSADEYKLTPQELYELGKRLFAKGELKEAAAHLTELLAKWNPAAEPYKESVRMLLDSHLQLGPPSEIVRYFEIVKEKWPELEIPFEKIVKVGAAYHEIGEYERSFLVFRATVESSFLRESGVAGFLEAQGEFLRSVEVMGRLLGEYPPEPYAASARYALAQRVYAYAPQAATDQKLREKKINKIDLIRQALVMLDNFLMAYPEDPAADQAAFSLANALLELKNFAEAIRQCQRYVTLYPKSNFVDSYLYIIGYSHFALSQDEEALKICRQVAETKHVDKQTGRETDSPNKWQAIYILGQVYHSLGKAANAVAEYTRVQDRYADAKQAIDYFMHQQIELPEVTTVKPGDAVEVELKYRNVPRCDTRVYRIDLMKFSLLKRNLAGITQINLAGIHPYHEALVELGDGKDYRDKTRKLALPLKDEGAYLVVCRGNDLHASGLVLVSPLTVDVQEETSSGLVRTTVKDTRKDSYLPEVHVKVIGTRNQDFVSGETDLRGVFSAQSIQGTSTVIAQADGNRYAFFRGRTELGPPPAAQPAAGKPADPTAPKSGEGKDGELLKELQMQNGILQQEQRMNLDNNYYQKNNKGVPVKAAF
jgi:uncharacterized protein YfaS (alpha-2-macroglobulin family)/TolA-binding protein